MSKESVAITIVALGAHATREPLGQLGAGLRLHHDGDRHLAPRALRRRGCALGRAGRSEIKFLSPLYFLAEIEDCDWE